MKLRAIVGVALSISGAVAAADTGTFGTWQFDDSSVYFAVRLDADGRCLVTARLKRGLAYVHYRQCAYSVTEGAVTLSWTDDPAQAPPPLRAIYSGEWDAFVIDGEPNRLLTRRSGIDR